MYARRGAASRRLCMMRSIDGSETRNTPTAERPVGPQASVNAAKIVPIAAGNRRFVAIARSNDAHVAISPRAMIGSGRVPLL